jgi:hypothetical protein
MRATIYYNADGSISSIIAGNGPPLGKAKMQAGERSVEIDVPDVPPNIDSNELAKRIMDIAQNNIIDVKSVAPRLAKKP